MIILQLPIGYGSFNPRSRMGSDTVKGDDFGAWLEFQSTLPHGERPDLIVYDYLTGEVSIHAPAWGATLEVQYVVATQEIKHFSRITELSGSLASFF